MGRVLFIYPIFLRHMRGVQGVVWWRRITPKIRFPDVQWCPERSTPSTSILAVTKWSKLVETIIIIYQAGDPLNLSTLRLLSNFSAMCIFGDLAQA